MKTILLILAVFSIQVEAQVLKNDQGHAVVEEVISFDSIPAKVLYAKAVVWVTKNFKNVEQVTDVLAKGESSDGVLYLNGIKAPRYPLAYAVTLDIKDGKIRFRMINMKNTHPPGYVIEQYLFKPSGDERTNGQAQAAKESVIDIAKMHILSLKAEITSIKKDDW